MNKKFSGNGKYYFPSGESYEGECKNGKAHGKGVFRFIDGSLYDGDW